MESKKKMLKECGNHEKRLQDDDTLRICETCGRHYYICELCRSSKSIDAPITICKLFFSDFSELYNFGIESFNVTFLKYSSGFFIFRWKLRF